MLKINHEFIKQVKYIKHVHLMILLYFYRWLSSNNPPKLRKFDGDDKLYFYIYLDKIAEDLMLSRGQVERAMYRLENKDKKIQTTLQPFIYPKQVKRENRLYIALNPVMIDFVISDENREIKEKVKKKLTGNTFYTKKIKSTTYNYSEADRMLLEESDLKIEKKKYSKEAEMIAIRIIKKYGTIFSHRIPEQNKQPTKTFQDICIKIQDIYNGNFNSRYYPLSDKFLSSKQFDISDYKEKLKEVKGDWDKVRKLLLNAVKNFELMFEENRMPFKKDYLQTNLSLWLYDSYGVKGEGQSQFIQSLNEPELQGKQLSENKADRIYDELSGKAQDGGNELVNIAPKGISSGTFWENIQKIVYWAELAFQFEQSIGYWLDSPSDILHKFAEFCKDKNIDVNCQTLDIDKAVNCNGPWVWFVNEAVKKHGLNSNLADCVTEDDFVDCYSCVF